MLIRIDDYITFKQNLVYIYIKLRHLYLNGMQLGVFQEWIVKDHVLRKKLHYV